MKIDFATVLKDFTGAPLTEVIDGKPTPVRLCEVVTTACKFAHQKDDSLGFAAKYAIFRIGLKSAQETTTEITTEEATLIKNRVALFFTPLVVGRVTDILEGLSEGPSESDPH